MGVVAIAVFALLHVTPGDPAVIIAGDYATSEDIAKIRAKLGLDQPFLTQVGIWLGRIVRGDLGTSIYSGLPVATLIGQRAEATIALTLFAMVISVSVAVPLGVLAAWKKGSLVDRAVMVFAVSGFSMPTFWLGFVLVYIFAVSFHWLPVQGFSPIERGFWPFLRHLILPAVTLSLVYMALIARMTRASMLGVLNEDYIRTAFAKGLAPRWVLVRHALKNASLPIVTIIGIGFALLIGGAVVTESVFALPGLGRSRRAIRAAAADAGARARGAGPDRGGWHLRAGVVDGGSARDAADRTAHGARRRPLVRDRQFRPRRLHADDLRHAGLAAGRRHRGRHEPAHRHDARPRHRLLPAPRRDHDARDGRPHGDSRHPARARSDGPDEGERAQRDHRAGDPGDSARDPRRPRLGPLAARAHNGGGRTRAGRAHAAHSPLVPAARALRPPSDRRRAPAAHSSVPPPRTGLRRRSRRSNWQGFDTRVHS